MGFRDHGPLEVVWEMLDVYVFFSFSYFPGRKIPYSCDSGTVALELDAGESSPSSSVYCWMTLSKLYNLLQKPHL